jgi:hypothetical protein
LPARVTLIREDIVIAFVKVCCEEWPAKGGLELSAACAVADFLILSENKNMEASKVFFEINQGNNLIFS